MRRTVIAAAMGWLLWQGVAPVLPNAPTEGAGVLQSYETKDECLKAVTTMRNIRRALVNRGQPATEVFACLPVGADQARAKFE
jgi:hypothetical protein